ncbi:MAG: N-acetyltransferase [Nitrospirales bacterium]|nr:N-acetyltransferase [Nitrospirales bacterium]
MDMKVRKERWWDCRRVSLVVKKAFEGKSYSNGKEAAFVARMRTSSSFIPELSLVAEVDNKVVGHLLFSPIGIRSDRELIPSLALAPVAVLPGLQGKGVGSALVRAGLERAKELGFSSVIVLGEPAFYFRFGFKPAALWGIEPPAGLPTALFLAAELVPGALSNVSGVVEYPEEFSGR